jgi:hypothetical protein
MKQTTPVTKNFNTSSFRLLLKKKGCARLSNEKPSRSSSSMSATSTELDQDFQRPNIETQVLDYLHFASLEFHPSRDPPI